MSDTQDLVYFQQKFIVACTNKIPEEIEKARRQLSLVVDAVAAYHTEKAKQQITTSCILSKN
jgi:hypothetical protein